MTVRPARRPDVPRASATLARAWADYRWSSWALPEDGRAQRLHRWCELAVLRGLDTDSVWTTDDGACVAVWAPPSPPPVAEDLQAVLDRDLPRMLGSRQPVVLASERLAEQGLPEGPHWRLVALGTLADRRHAGLAAEVCRPVLERCDADGVPPRSPPTPGWRSPGPSGRASRSPTPPDGGRPRAARVVHGPPSGRLRVSRAGRRRRR